MYFTTVKEQWVEAAMAFPLLFYCLGLSCAHVICLHQIHPHFPQCLPYLHVYFPLLILCTLFIYFLTYWVQLVLAICILVESHPLQHGQSIWGSHISKENWLFLYKQPSVTNSSLCMGGALWGSSSSMLGFCLWDVIVSSYCRWLR